MRHRPFGNHFSILLVGLVAFASFVRPPGSAQETTVLGKIDPPLLAVLDSGGSARVIVLGRTQLFEPVGGLEAFQLEHTGADRLELRREVVGVLKRNAEAEQKRILRALGRIRRGSSPLDSQCPIAGTRCCGDPGRQPAG